MDGLYDGGQINSMKTGNRFVRSAIWEGMAAENGAATPGLNRLMTDLAAADVGLLITGHAFVAAEGRAGPWQLGAHRDDLIPGLRQMTDAVHGAGGKIMLQIAHAGGHAATHLTGMAAQGPSEFEGRSGDVCRAMTLGDIKQVVHSMTRAAQRAVQAGFDGVQIHAAHGYLLSQFLSPTFNHRNDHYGGSLENRSRLVLDLVHSIRNALGDDYPVIIKINSDDFTPDGWAVDDMVKLAVLLESADIDGVELSGGTITNPVKTHCARKVHPKKTEQEVYYKKAARRFREAVDLPLILVGGIRTYGVCQEIIDDGLADFVSLGRPLIAEPDLIRRWISGHRSRSICISCNRCYEPILAGEGVSCPEFSGRSLD